MDQDEKERRRLEVLLKVQEDARGEIRQRITQRDSFGASLIVAIGGILTISVSVNSYASFLVFLIPLFTDFFAMQIFYSYSIHEGLSNFLSDCIEPKISELMGVGKGQRQFYLWESHTHYNALFCSQKVLSIRKNFFKIMLFVSPFIASITFVLLQMNGKLFSDDKMDNLKILLLIAGIFLLVYLCLSFLILFRSHKKYDFRSLGETDYKSEEAFGKKKVIFLDRDGTIIVDKVQPRFPAQIEFFPDTISALKKLQEAGFSFVILSNQDGIAQGHLTREEFHHFNEVLLQKLNKEGIYVLAVYYSVHEEKDRAISFKPNPGMIYKAQMDFQIDIDDSYLIGDQMSDYEAGDAGGVSSIMVTTGIYSGPDPKRPYATKDFLEEQPVCFPSLGKAADYILKNQK